MQLMALKKTIDIVTHHNGQDPNSASRKLAHRILGLLVLNQLEPSRVIASGEGGIAFLFENDSKYADIECLNSGSVLAGMIDFRTQILNEVIEIDIESSENFSPVCSQIKKFLSLEN